MYYTAMPTRIIGTHSGRCSYTTNEVPGANRVNILTSAPFLLPTFPSSLFLSLLLAIQLVLDVKRRIEWSLSFALFGFSNDVRHAFLLLRIRVHILP